MNKRVIALLLLPLLIAIALPAAAASKVERDLAELKRRLELVEQATLGKGSSQIEERLAEIVRMQADQQAEMDALRVEFQKLNGAFDDLAHSRKELHELISLVRSEMEVKSGALEAKLAKLEAEIKAGAGKPVAVKSPEELYGSALDLIRKQNAFAEGRKALQEFIKNYPKHDLAVNASYWIGEAYYGEKKYENAILQFNDILKAHPDHNKAPAALLKQALGFQALGDKESSQALLKKLIKQYPKTPEAKKAKERLGK